MQEKVQKYESTNSGVPTMVLVHGGFVDGSGWRGVYGLLKDDHDVKTVQNPTISLEGGVAATKIVVGAQSGPVILVGHSCGGVVISEASNDPKVVGLKPSHGRRYAYPLPGWQKSYHERGPFRNV